MLTVESWFNNLPSPPQHMIACAFEANLPFAEHGILDRLHRGGARNLTVLVGERDYAESFAEVAATRHAGVFYAFHRVHLPGYLAAFHPKLYLLSWRDSARLLVSSANLTPTGFRSNLEVADELRLDAGAQSDKLAFLEYASLLDALPRIDDTLAPRVAERLAAAANDVRELADRSEQREDGAIFLHSAERPLLEQLRAVIGDDVIRNITLVSPFFDDGSKGVLSLVRAFDRGRNTPELRLIKDWNAMNELDGRALTSLGEGVRVERLHGLTMHPDVHRALHAKVVVLESHRRSWVIIGSANATAAAWQRSAPNGGNLEAITVRSLPVSQACDLLDALTTEPLGHRDLTRQIEDRRQEIVRSCIIHSATVVGELMELRCSEGAWFSSVEHVQARLTSREGSTQIPLIVHSRSAGEVTLRTLRSDDLLHTGVAVAVVVEMKAGPLSRTISTAAWLDKPLFQELDPELRSGVRALSQLGEMPFVDTADPLHDAAQFIASITVRLAADLTSAPIRAKTPSAPVVKEDGADEEADDWDEADLESAGDQESKHTMQNLPGGATVRKMGGAHLRAHVQMAQRLFDGLLASRLSDLEDDEDFENAAATRRMNRLRTNLSDELDDQGHRRPKPLSLSGRRLLRQGLSTLEGALTRVLRMKWSPEHVPRLTAMVDALTAALLRFAQHAAEWDYNLWAASCSALRATWNHAWSIDGFLFGQSHGLYPRAISDPELGAAIRIEYADVERFARVGAMLAMTAAICRPDRSSELLVPPGVLQGLAIVTGGAPLDSAEVQDRIEKFCAEFATNVEELDMAAVRLALAMPSFGLTPESAILRAWLPVIRLEEARRRNPEATAFNIDSLANQVPRQIFVRYRQVVRGGRKLGSIVSAPSGLTCSQCRNALPSEWQAKLTNVDFTPVCESCGTLLAPVAWEDDVVAATISRLEESLKDAPFS
jgi:hypothetical protein